MMKIHKLLTFADQSQLENDKPKPQSKRKCNQLFFDNKNISKI